MKQQDVATDGNAIVQAVCERLAQHKPPTLTQTRELLEQYAVAQTEIKLLCAALNDASEALEAALLAMARERKAQQLANPSVTEQRQEKLAFFYEVLLTRASNNDHAGLSDLVAERHVGA